MTRDAQLHLRVKSDQKQDWKDAVGDTGKYRDLTHLITVAVENELNNSNTNTTSANTDLTVFENHFDNLHDAINNLADRVEDLETKVDDDSAVVELGRKILPLLPRVESLTELRIPDDEVLDTDSFRKLMKEYGREKDILQYFIQEPYPPFIVRRALDKLVSEMERVHTVELQGSQRYYIEQ